MNSQPAFSFTSEGLGLTFTATGERGAAGVAGPKGDKGDRGDAGADGLDSLSATTDTDLVGLLAGNGATVYAVTVGSGLNLTGGVLTATGGADLSDYARKSQTNTFTAQQIVGPVSGAETALLLVASPDNSPLIEGYDSDGNQVFVLRAVGQVEAVSFVGDGSQLTALNASALGTGTVPAARLPGRYAGFVKDVTAGSFTLDPRRPAACSLSVFRVRAASGTFTATVAVNGTPVGAWTGLTPTGTLTGYAASVAVAVGDRLTLTLAAVSGSPIGFEFSLE